MNIGDKISDPNRYKPTKNIDRVVKLEVIVMLDSVPGAWHDPIDIMTYISRHSYVQSVEFKGDI